MDLSKLTDEQLAIAIKVSEAAERRGLNPEFVLPMVMQESGFNPSAKSPAGAVGVMQLMPDTAKSLKVNANNIDENIDGGMRLLKELVSNEKIGDDPYKVLAAYNTSTETRNKFLQSGDLNVLPDETINHMLKVSEYYGGDLPNVIGQPKAEEVIENEVPVEPTAEVGTVESTPAAQTSPVVGGVIGGTLGAGAGASTAVLEAKKDLAKKGLEMAGVLKKPVEAPVEGTTPGGKWGAKTGYGTGEGTVQESSSRYQRAVPKGKISGRQAKLWGIAQPGESSALVERMLARSAAAEEAAKAAQVAESTSPLWGYAKHLASLPVKGALSGASAGYGAMDVANRLSEKRPGEAALSGLGTIAGAVAPFVGAAAAPLTLTGTAIPLYLSAADRLRYLQKHPEAHQAPEVVKGMRFGPMGEPYQD